MRGRSGCGRIAKQRVWSSVRGSRSSGSGRFAGRDMSAWRFILVSLRHYRRIHLAVAAGVAVATAVLTGALLVGDSMRGSLRDLTLERLGRIDSAVVAAHPFRAELANKLAREPSFRERFSSAQSAILVN